MVLQPDAVLILKNSLPVHNLSLACLLQHAVAAMTNLDKTNMHVLQFLPTCLQARTHA